MNLYTSIDWNVPWLDSRRELGQSVSRGVGRSVEEHALCNTHANASSLVNALNMHKGELSFDFIDQSKLCDHFTYETYVEQSRCIPTRANSHDFFNGLSWIKYPKAKTAMLGLQAKAAGQSVDQDLKSVRGPLRDALTVFDENGILLQADDRIWRALQDKDWQSLFIEHRALWDEARVWLFGHALLEKLLQPRTAITGHVLQLKITNELGDDQLDEYLFSRMNALNWCAKPFYPLPVLGIPNWYEKNSDPNFYSDRSVFR